MKAAGGEAQLQDLLDGNAGANLPGIDAVDFGIARIGDDQSLVGIVHAQALRHVVDSDPHALVVRAQHP